ncbi:MAG TPA: AAA family ATPase [Tepidiformaceae bacterium]|nr:AAA family ATPase [Tepidiformaceae bacterium]
MAINAAEPMIVERERELETLRHAAEEAGAGIPSVVLLVGEPGLGKSHLLRAVRGAEGTVVLRGYSLEDDAPPYFAFRRALARHSRENPLRAPHATLDILSAAGILAGRSPVSGAAPADRLAVFDALTELFIGMAAESPLILVLDDMQWASGAAWDAIGYIARAAEGARLLVVLASRPEGIEAGGPGGAAIAELNRNGLLHFCSLRPLTIGGVAEVAERTLGSRAAPALTSALSSRTGGNPFFLQEVLRGVAESGGLVSTPEGLTLASDAGSRLPVPETLRLAIWQRFSRLPGPTVEVLRRGAIIGRVFEQTVVAAMAVQPQEWVSEQIALAIRAGIVNQDSPGTWAFAHDMLRDAMLESIGAERAALHLAAATALAATEGANSQLEVAARIAYHLREGGDARAAIVASIHASSLALAHHASEEALELALGAETLFQQSAGGDSHLAPREVHRAVARAADAAADYTLAEASWGRAYALTTDPHERARILVSMATVARKAERSEQAATRFIEALELLEGSSDTRTLVEALVELTTLEGTTRSDYGVAIERGERALRLAREMGDAGLEARAALALANARARSDAPTNARPMLLLALERALAVDELTVAAEAAASLSNSHYWTGEIREAVAYAERRLEIAERGRDAFALRHAHSWLAMLATTIGDWDRAHAMIRRAEPAIARMGSPEPLGFLRVVEGLLALRTGEIDLVLLRTREAMTILAPLGDATVSWYVAIRIWALIAADRKEEAAAECAAQEERLARMPDNALPARSSRCGLGRAYVALGDLERARACEAKLAPFADDFHWRPARLTLAALAAMRGDRERARELLSAVEALEERNGLHHDLAETRKIVRLLDEGAPVAMTFGWIEAHPPRVPLTGAPIAGLSPREREVLQLVAQGLSNRAIAEQLVLSERTVVNHVSHIFEKIGVDNRAAATAFAFRSGIAAPE